MLAPATQARTAPARDEVPSSFATLAADRARLAYEVQHLRAENADLKSHSFELSVLLDAALAKLESLGHSMVPTFTAADHIQRLRSSREEAARSKMWSLPAMGPGAETLPLPARGGEASAMQLAVTEHSASNAAAAPSVVTGASSQAVNTATARYRNTVTITTHRGAVFAAEFCPQSIQGGHLVATASFDSSVAVSNAQTGSVDAKAADHGAAVMDVVWHPSGRAVVSCSLDGVAAVRDVETQLAPKFVYRSPGSQPSDFGVGFVRLLAVPERPHLFIVSDNAGGVSIIDDREGRGRVAYVQHTDVITALSSDGASNGIAFFGGDTRGVVTLWDLRSVAQPVPSALGTPAPARKYDVAKMTTSFVTSSSTQSAGQGASHVAGISHLSWSQDTYGSASLVTFADDGSVRLFVDDTPSIGSQTRGSDRGVGLAVQPQRLTGGAAAIVAAPVTTTPAGGSPQAPGLTGTAFPAVPAAQDISSNSVGVADRAFRIAAKVTLPTQLCPIRGAFRHGTKQGINSRLMLDDEDGDTAQASRRVKLLGDEDLLACGGADSIVRVFQRTVIDRRQHATVTGDEGKLRGGGDRDIDDAGDAEAGSSENATVMGLYQQLEGHRDVVYGAAFHRGEPVIASHSGDSTVRIWRPARLVGS